MCDFKANLRLVFSDNKYQEIVDKVKGDNYNNFFVDVNSNKESDYRVLVSYKKCDEKSDRFTKFNRGTIYDAESGRLIVPSFGYTRDLVCSDESKEQIKELFGSDCLFLESHEGTLLRVYFYDGEWKVSTHRKLDAFRSKWSSKMSFGQMFLNGLRNYGIKGESDEEVFKNFTDTLSIFNTYFVFLCSNKDTQIVCEDSESTQRLYHVGTLTYDDVDNPVFRFDVDIGIPYPNILKFNDYESLVSYVNNIDYTKSQGVFAIDPNMNTFKVLNSEYSKIHFSKSNKYKLTYSYLKNRNNDESKTKFMTENINENKTFFENLEKSISSLGRYLFDVYINRYVKKNFIKIKTRQHYFITKCHEWHKQDRKNNIVRIDVIFNRLNTLPPHILMSLLNE